MSYERQIVEPNTDYRCEHCKEVFTYEQMVNNNWWPDGGCPRSLCEGTGGGVWLTALPRLTETDVPLLEPSSFNLARLVTGGVR